MCLSGNFCFFEIRKPLLSTVTFLKQEGYEGNGRSCQVAAECLISADCGYRSICNQGVCECDTGYERDNSDL